MAGYQPSEGEIQNFMIVVPGMARHEVIARIKNNNNNVEYAINEYYEDPGDPKNKYRWVDGQFSSDRDGEYMQNNPPSFNIHAPDDTGPYEVREPQTRPPSRTTNNRSPIGAIIDLTMDHANADPRTSVSHDDDPELQRAIEASRVSAGLTPQESGVMSTDKVSFGPATRAQYEEDKWGMVTVGKSSAQEILLDPEPAGRKRDLNVPAFLKPSIENNRLGALFTIYHEIPLLREVFMNRSDVLQNYGFDSEWWAGKSIELPVIAESELHEGQELLYEIQRLFAFLDKTDRSYGSVDALANIRLVKRMQRLNLPRSGTSNDIEIAVLQAWKKLFESRETGQVSKLFSIGVDGEKQAEITEFAILDLPLPTKGSGVETFYDIADEALWGSQYYQMPLDIANYAYLDHIGEVITFRLNEDSTLCENIEVPAIWYADRYLKSGRQAALDMRLQKTEVIEEIRKITGLQDCLTEVSARGKMVKVQNLLSAALQHDLDKVEVNGDTTLDETFVSEDVAISKSSSEKAAKLSAELGKIVANIDKKLLALNSEKEKAKNTLRELSKLYTSASSDPSPTHKYTLRGVSTTNNTMYILRKAEMDLIDMGLDNDEALSNVDQWWRISYSFSSSNPVTVEKMTEDKVLEAAKTESKNIILVYASEKAMHFEAKPLPLPLETFVRNDNECFQLELSAEETQSQASHVTSPSKRKFDAQSDNSEESSRWNRGTSPKGYENSVQVMERELRSTDGAIDLAGAHIASKNLAIRLDESRTVTPDLEHEILVGVDPSMLSNDDTPFLGQEMQERRGMPMLSNRTGASKASTVDGMDLDHVMEDENITEESAAVKNVGLAS